MNLCVIPARGGSKRIPRKNIRDFCGKPMIAWSIEAAISSGCFQQVVVSTDNDEIADIARSWGAQAPFIRPHELANDFSATRPVIVHAIREMIDVYGELETVCCLYATAPFVLPEDLQKGLVLLKENNAPFVFSATTFNYPIQRAIRKLKSNGVEWIYPEYRCSRTQDLEVTYHDAAQFYFGSSHAFCSSLETVSPQSQMYLLPSFRVHDIDTIEDWQRAELFFNALNK